VADLFQVVRRVYAAHALWSSPIAPLALYMVAQLTVMWHTDAGVRSWANKMVELLGTLSKGDWEGIAHPVAEDCMSTLSFVYAVQCPPPANCLLGTQRCSSLGLSTIPYRSSNLAVRRRTASYRSPEKSSGEALPPSSASSATNCLRRNSSASTRVRLSTLSDLCAVA
jgi:hypothetical protein